MKTPVITPLKKPAILRKATKLATTGKLALSKTKLLYLDIDDGYIHDLFPLLNDEQIQKPLYFGKDLIGAHISVIYPQEVSLFAEENVGKEFSFKVENVVSAEIGHKTYYVLMVKSDSLLQIRKAHHLSNLLYFKGYGIEFHITLGVVDHSSKGKKSAVFK